MRIKVGDRVRVSDGSGCDSRRIGTVISRETFNKLIKTNSRGVPEIIGHYKTINWNREVAIEYDDKGSDGGINTMFKNRLILI